MSSPLEQAGAVKEPSEYATLSMDRGITGLWTQRSPLRDADVPYLYSKFYSASRFDSLIDGLNREITSRLTYGRRPGNSVYNSNSFPAVNSFYAFKRINNGAQIIRVIADCADGTIYDATAGGKSAVFVKGAGAGKARFQGVNTALYFCDGVENKKWLQPAGWATQPSLTTTKYAVGTLVIDSNGKLEYLSAVKVGTINNVTVQGSVVTLGLSGTPAITPGMSFTPSGLGTATFLNGQRLVALSVTPGQVTAFFFHAAYASAADSGICTTSDVGTPATTGGSAPTWAGGVGGATTDGNSTWTNFGTPIFDWGPPAAPSQAPTLSNFGGLYNNTGIWQASSQLPSPAVIMDGNGMIQSLLQANPVTGIAYPNFVGETANASPPAIVDGLIKWFRSTWLNTTAGSISPPTPWKNGITPHVVSQAGGDTIVDKNGNVQMVYTGTGATGGTEPTWNTTVGLSTTDSSLTWINCGPYLALAFVGVKYGYAYHCIDGSVSTLSPLTPSTNAVLAGTQIGGFGSGSSQVDSIWIFRTADGEPTPLFLASIPNPGAGVAWTFNDYTPDSFLVPEIVGPQAHRNDPPPVGMTAPLYHLGRMWAIYQNAVIVSGGPDVLVGNGLTAFAPLSVFPIPDQPVRLTATVTSQGPALLIWGRANIWAIYGQGTLSSPFQQASMYMPGVGILNYDAVTQIGSTFYAFGNPAMVGGNAVGKAFSLDPGGGYTEYGFPIGDQFANVTTGRGGKNPGTPPIGYLYDPTKTYVAWAELGSGDTALYVADGSVGWFRYSPVASPESGFLWSPRAVIVGGTSAVQGVETTPGISQLLIGPATNGPILFRDSTTSQDNGTSYPSYDVKGCIQLCVTGEVAEIAHIHLVSAAVGARPVVGVLFGEILATTAAPFSWHDRTCSEPPTLPPSQTIYSDRYTMLDNGVAPKCQFFQLAMDYGTQNFPDETQMFSIYGAKFAERKQQ
jgi:hypothetical protein